MALLWSVWLRLLSLTSLADGQNFTGTVGPCDPRKLAWMMDIQILSNRMIEQWKRLSVYTPSSVVPSLLVFLNERPLTTHYKYTFHALHVVTPWRHNMMLRRDVIWHFMSWQRESTWVKSENPKITFFDLVTLTYDLDLRTHMRYCQCQMLYQILGPYVKLFSHERAEWQTDRHTHGYTDGTDFIPLTADAGGNQKMYLDEDEGWVYSTLVLCDFSHPFNCNCLQTWLQGPCQTVCLQRSTTVET